MSRTTMSLGEEVLSRLLNRRLRAVIAPRGLSPLQITGIYAIFGFLALYFSDVYLPRAVEDTALLVQLQAVKGGVEILVTAGVILLLTTRSQRAIARQNDRLDTLRAERDILHRVFRHNLRQDINVIMGFTELLQEAPDDGRSDTYCRAILDRLDGIEAYQDPIMKIERILEPPAALQRLDLAALVRDHPSVRQLQDADDVSVTLELPASASVVATPYVDWALEEVLENALEHNDADEPAVRIAIEERTDGLVGLTVTDNGPGIPEYERRVVEGLQEGDLSHSSGLGLWLAKLTCSVSGGELAIPDRAGGGEVVLRVPEAYDRTIRRSLSTLPG